MDDGLHWAEPRRSGQYRRMTTATDFRTTTAGIRLASLSKSYGPGLAVDGIDLVLGLTKPNTGSVQVFGMTPADAVRAGAIGAMLQTGQLLRDLSVREL